MIDPRHGGSMDTSIGRDRFCESFEGRVVVIAKLPAGRSRVLAHVASQRAGRDDGSLRTRAEYMALFDLLLTHVSSAALTSLKLLDDAAQPTAAAQAIEDYIAALQDEAGVLRRGPCTWSLSAAFSLHRGLLT